MIGSVFALLLAPAISLAASPSAHGAATTAKSVSLTLADVTHVLGRGLTNNGARYSKATAMGVCPSSPPTTQYDASFMGSLHTKGVLTVISDIYAYRTAAGPVCNQKYEISTAKLAGAILGKLTIVHGVGTQAFLLDTTGPKSPGPPVYTVSIKFTRGLYRALIIVQSNKPIKSSDMLKLGKIVDGRMKRTG